MSKEKLDKTLAYLEKKDNPNWKNVGKNCSHEKCEKPARSLGLCSTHYARHLAREKRLKLG